jgi:FkbM family methyltransferase
MSIRFVHHQKKRLPSSGLVRLSDLPIARWMGHRLIIVGSIYESPYYWALECDDPSIFEGYERLIPPEMRGKGEVKTWNDFIELKKSIKSTGYKSDLNNSPIFLDDERGQVDGHHRLAILAHLLGAESHVQIDNGFIRTTDEIEKPLVSYAQNFEDVMLWRALKHIQRGFYIDVGANDPVSDSVTKLFYDAGWCGINIEPLQSYYQDLVRMRERDINLKVAAGADNGHIDLWECDIPGLTTACAEVVAMHLSNGHYGAYKKVPVLPLRDICAQYVEQDIHFLKIDVEGLEQEVLNGMDFSKYRPWIVVVESMKPNSMIEAHQLWEDHLRSQDYLFAYADGLNRFYLAGEKHELLNKLRYPPNVFDGFMKAQQYHSEISAHRSRVEFEQTKNELQQIQVQLGQTQSQLTQTLNVARTLQAQCRTLQSQMAQQAGQMQALVKSHLQEKQELNSQLVSLRQELDKRY